jgi:hypothetical protein
MSQVTHEHDIGNASMLAAAGIRLRHDRVDRVGVAGINQVGEVDA